MTADELHQRAKQIRFLILDVDGTLTDGGIYIDANGVQSKKFNVKDGMGIRLIQDRGIQVGIISHTRSNTILETRAKMLGLHYVYAGMEPKREVLQRWLDELDLTIEQVAFIGDDVNDLDIIAEAGLSACPQDAHNSVLGHVHFILQSKGGEGCVREFIDRFLM